MSTIEWKRIGEQVGLTKIEATMRDEEIKTIKKIEKNIFVNFHPNEGAHILGFSYIKRLEDYTISIVVVQKHHN